MRFQWLTRWIERGGERTLLRGSKRTLPGRALFHPLLDPLETRLAPAVHMWTGMASGSSNWSDPLNWANGVPNPADGADDLVFGPTASSRLATNDIGPIDLRSIAVTADNYLLDGASVTLFGGLTNSGINTNVSLGVALKGPAQTFSNSGSLLLQGALRQDITNLTFDTQGAGFTQISGPLTGTGQLNVNGSGFLLVSAVNPAYTGNVDIKGGTLALNGTIGSNVFLSGGEFRGAATVRDITVRAGGGVVAPGTSPGIMKAGGAISFNAATTFAVDIFGNRPGVNYDQLIVNGAVNLGGSTLSINADFALSPGEQLVIVKNDGAGAVKGIFSYGQIPLYEGSVFSLGGTTLLQISYKGGDSNDVVLTLLAAFPAPSAPDLSAADDTGFSNTDNITRVTTPTFTGTAVPLSVVELFANGQRVGGATAGTDGRFSITAGPALAAGPSVVEAQATDAQGNKSPLSQSLFLVVDNSAPVGQGQPVSGPAGQDLTALVATFTNPSLSQPTDGPPAPVGGFGATIDWGDGQTTPGIITTDGAGTYQVTGTHRYAQPGNFAADVLITDVAGNSTLVPTTVTIVAATAPVVAKNDIGVAIRNEFFVRAGSFHDPDGGPWIATVNYGDGSGEQLLALNQDQTFTLEHVYTIESTFTVTIRVRDSGGEGIDAFKVIVLLEPVTAYSVGTAQPGTSVTATVPDGTISATLERSANETTPASVLVATFASFPVNATADPPLAPFIILASFDIRTVDAGPDDLLTVTIIYPDTLEARALDFAGVNPTLIFFNAETGRLEVIEGSRRVPNSFVVDRVHRRITVIFDRTSHPHLQVFNGTPVAVVAPGSFQLQSAPTVAPSAATTSASASGVRVFAATPPAASSSTFVSSAPLTLALASSQTLNFGIGGDDSANLGPDRRGRGAEEDAFWPWLQVTTLDEPAQGPRALAHSTDEEATDVLVSRMWRELAEMEAEQAVGIDIARALGEVIALGAWQPPTIQTSLGSAEGEAAMGLLLVPLGLSQRPLRGLKRNARKPTAVA